MHLRSIAETSVINPQAFRSVPRGTLPQRNHQHILCESVWPYCQHVNTKARWRLQGLLANVRGQQDHSKGDFIACGVATMWEVTRVRPHISGKDRMDCTCSFIPHSHRIHSACLHCVLFLSPRICLCLLHTVSLPLITVPPWFCCVHNFTFAFIFLLSCVRPKSPTHHIKAKSWRAFSCLKDYIMWFSVQRVYIHTHKHGCRRRDMCTQHTLTVSVLLTQTCFEHVRTNSTNTSLHKHMLSDDATPPPQPAPSLSKASWTLASPKAERQRHRKRSVDLLMCILFIPQPALLFLSLVVRFPSSKLQIQRSVSSTCGLAIAHANIPSTFICFGLRLAHGLCVCTHPSPAKWHRKNSLISCKLKNWMLGATFTEASLSAVSPSE